MRLRHYKLVGMEVVAADGKRLGRVADLEAAADGEALRVTALLIGPRALVRRISNLHITLLRRVLPRLRIPWAFVAMIDQQVHLSVTRDELRHDDSTDAPATGADEP